MITSINPATGEIVWQGKESGEVEINLALENALNAHPSWKKLGFEKRASFCKQMADTLKKKKVLFARAISEEMGKPLWESLTEVDAMIAKVDISISAYKERTSPHEEKMAKSLLATRFSPHGVCLVLGPFNFPGHLPHGHIVPALLAGNTILYKPSELTPKVGALYSELWHESGLPAGVLNLLQGAKKTAEIILSSPDIRAVFFTGSVQAGRAILEHSFKFPGRLCALEMGGNNPLVVTQVKDRKALLYAIILSAYLSSGQRCSCARRLIVSDDTILSPLVAATKSLAVGPFTDTPEPFMGPVVTNATADRLYGAYNELLAHGGKALLPCKRTGSTFLSPAIVDMTGCTQHDVELFGPILQVVRVKNLDEAITEANRTSFGLTAALFSDSYDEYQQFYQQVRAGVINWNMPTTGASSKAPFGGIGLSGNFHPSAYFAADYSAYPIASQEAEKLFLPDTILPGVKL